MWFPDIPLTCTEMAPTEEDIAPEHFITSWYAFDKDADEIVSENDFISWAHDHSDFYSWMSE